MNSKPILFIDWHKTLSQDFFWASLEPRHYDKVHDYLFIQRPQLINDWMVGEYTAEDINTLLARELEIDYQYLWRTFVHDCQVMKVEKEILKLVQSLRDSFRVILLTDNMDSFNRFTIPALDLDFYFDDIINSYHTGLCKVDNDGEIIRKILSGHRADVRRSCLIDDSAETCEIFRRLGGEARLVTGDKTVLDHLRAIC